MHPRWECCTHHGDALNTKQCFIGAGMDAIETKRKRTKQAWTKTATLAIAHAKLHQYPESRIPHGGVNEWAVRRARGSETRKRNLMNLR